MGDNGESCGGSENVGPDVGCQGTYGSLSIPGPEQGRELGRWGYRNAVSLPRAPGKSIHDWLTSSVVKGGCSSCLSQALLTPEHSFCKKHQLIALRGPRP